MPPMLLTILTLVECLPNMPPTPLAILTLAVPSRHASNAAYPCVWKQAAVFLPIPFLFDKRSRYLNASSTLTTRLNHGVIPIINQNNTLSVAKIKFGDNDTISAITAAMCHAEFLFLMTDVSCLYTENPCSKPNAQIVKVVYHIEGVRKIVSTATLGSSLGTGGMATKRIAAKMATVAGVSTVI
ncbi:hypothetical protein O181_000987 [Austropuccinia psidii MF-1]|uniref:Aspartate/glutamate/uridylate kinase domain-containing protein n=1 Tax=Austropuccinia psidii MF-1 TaxID=1389203 RepID=A0A9Q3B9Q3_9BASI|nr:hypothetical protein [Austropuccinia psidii MF-1]